ncbi:hypothetical protein ASF27_20145 [Methylobacterium sp. Leaf102]|uniref:hypothetical protein n=1 Tax=Methylobacterium sp. Leaf102 TaxID=1736253 RepID=UPI0007158938|nr:hypothetical protein [Methylobacterium sp. Leaf102]KQP29475.1 hypothetical protein ASF27_20145 [Methylobacterium sp. Leaf102]
MGHTSRISTLKLLVLDSSHLGQFVKDLNSRRADERRRASDFQGLLDAGNWILALSYHHLAEIYTHADAAVRGERLAYIRSRPVVAYVRAGRGPEAGFGSIVDVLGTEVAAALATGFSETLAIADAARPDVFAFASGRDVMRPLDEVGPYLGENMRRQRERTQRTVAISQADVEKAPNVTLRELFRLPLRTPEDHEAFLRRFGARMTSEVTERGDPGIENPAEVAAWFTATVREAMRQAQESGVHPIVYLLGAMGLRPEELDENATIEDLQRIAFHHHRASIAARGTGVDPTVVRERVRAERLPSAVIGDAMDRFGQQPRRRKGSVMNDVHLVSLSPYAGLTSVDKGTFANVERASARSPVFKSIIGAVARARTYADLMPHLSTDPGRDMGGPASRE